MVRLARMRPSLWPSPARGRFVILGPLRLPVPRPRLPFGHLRPGGEVLERGGHAIKEQRGCTPIQTMNTTSGARARISRSERSRTGGWSPCSARAAGRKTPAAPVAACTRRRAPRPAPPARNDRATAGRPRSAAGPGPLEHAHQEQKLAGEAVQPGQADAGEGQHHMKKARWACGWASPPRSAICRVW